MRDQNVTNMWHERTNNATLGRGSAVRAAPALPLFSSASDAVWAQACVKYYHNRDDLLPPEMRANIDRSLLPTMLLPSRTKMFDGGLRADDGAEGADRASQHMRIVARSGLLGGARKARIREILAGE